MTTKYERRLKRQNRLRFSPIPEVCPFYKQTDGRVFAGWDGSDISDDEMYFIEEGYLSHEYFCVCSA